MDFQQNYCQNFGKVPRYPHICNLAFCYLILVPRIVCIRSQSFGWRALRPGSGGVAAPTKKHIGTMPDHTTMMPKNQAEACYYFVYPPQRKKLQQEIYRHPKVPGLAFSAKASLRFYPFLYPLILRINPSHLKKKANKVLADSSQVRGFFAGSGVQTAGIHSYNLFLTPRTRSARSRWTYKEKLRKDTI